MSGPRDATYLNDQAGSNLHQPLKKDEVLRFS